MSMFSACFITCKTSEETANCGQSLANTLYAKPLTILLSGELGVGKTTFTQGFAKGLGIVDAVVSPTYALEQRYNAFTHIDLYRLSKEQAQNFLLHSEDFQGIRVIEWAERIDPQKIGPHISVHITDQSGKREIRCKFLDELVPETELINQWKQDVRLPRHIQEHSNAVARLCHTLAEALSKDRHWVIRKEALHAAGRTHDILRFVDFVESAKPSKDFQSPEDLARWKELKEKYGPSHEEAGAAFLTEQGFPSIGDIIRTHRGIAANGQSSPRTIEQLILAYADKRVLFDTIVSLDERFDNFMQRYGDGKETASAKKWRETMKNIEKMLFPEGAPVV